MTISDHRDSEKRNCETVPEYEYSFFFLFIEFGIDGDIVIEEIATILIIECLDKILIILSFLSCRFHFYDSLIFLFVEIENTKWRFTTPYCFSPLFSFVGNCCVACLRIHGNRNEWTDDTLFERDVRERVPWWDLIDIDGISELESDHETSKM